MHPNCTKNWIKKVCIILEVLWYSFLEPELCQWLLPQNLKYSANFLNSEFIIKLGCILYSYNNIRKISSFTQRLNFTGSVTGLCFPIWASTCDNCGKILRKFYLRRVGWLHELSFGLQTCLQNSVFQLNFTLITCFWSSVPNPAEKSRNTPQTSWFD